MIANTFRVLVPIVVTVRVEDLARTPYPQAVALAERYVQEGFRRLDDLKSMFGWSDEVELVKGQTYEIR